MMKLATIFENSQRLAITAAEEAQRFGHPAIDVEHVFLALLVSETDAGHMLRSRGIRLDAARQAVQSEHAARLTALGAGDVQVPHRDIRGSSPGDIEWNERVLTLFSHSGGDGSGIVLLRSLVSDAGGFVAAMLERLDANPAEILTAAEAAIPSSTPTDSSGARSGAGPSSTTPSSPHRASRSGPWSTTYNDVQNGTTPSPQSHPQETADGLGTLSPKCLALDGASPGGCGPVRSRLSNARNVASCSGRSASPLAAPN